LLTASTQRRREGEVVIAASRSHLSRTKVRIRDVYAGP
jgi:hypothetical protein